MLSKFLLPLILSLLIGLAPTASAQVNTVGLGSEATEEVDNITTQTNSTYSQLKKKNQKPTSTIKEGTDSSVKHYAFNLNKTSSPKKSRYILHRSFLI